MRLVVSPEMNGFAALPVGVRPDVLFPGLAWQGPAHSRNLHDLVRAAIAKLVARQPVPAPEPAPRRFADCVDLLDQAIPERPSRFAAAPQGRSFSDAMGILSESIPPKLTFGDLNVPVPDTGCGVAEPLAETA